jgi:hypothetical protein
MCLSLFEGNKNGFSCFNVGRYTDVLTKSWQSAYIDIQQKMKGSLKYKFLGLVWGLDFSPKPKRASIEKLLIYY